jgi:hypothetical protein
MAEWRTRIEQVQVAGFTGDLVEGVKTPDGTRTLQVRGEKHLAPLHMVARYKACMMRGDRFPPIVCTGDYYIIDGNTRVQAALKANIESLLMIRLHIDYEGATESQLARLRKLGTALNNQNGEGMSKGSVEKQIASFYGPGVNAKALAAELHYPESTVYRVFKICEGRQWLARLGLTDEKNRLTAGHYEVFGNWQQKRWMNDTVLAVLVELAMDAKFTISQTKELGLEVTELTSDTAKLDLLDAKRRENKPRIAGISRGPSRPGQFRQALGTVLAFEKDVEDAIEHDDPEDKKRQEEMLIRVQRIIERGLKGQLTENNPQVIAPTRFYAPGR